MYTHRGLTERSSSIKPVIFTTGTFHLRLLLCGRAGTSGPSSEPGRSDAAAAAAHLPYRQLFMICRHAALSRLASPVRAQSLVSQRAAVHLRFRSTTACAPPSASPAESPARTTPSSTAAYLRAQAELDEADDLAERARRRPAAADPDERPWDGDEPQDRAIRRILADQYKPLRVKVG